MAQPEDFDNPMRSLMQAIMEQCGGWFLDTSGTPLTNENYGGPLEKDDARMQQWARTTPLFREWILMRLTHAGTATYAELETWFRESLCQALSYHYMYAFESLVDENAIRTEGEPQRWGITPPSAPGALRPSQRFAIIRRDGYRCRMCGAQSEDGAQLEVDHKIPRARGGTNDPSNLWTLCFTCNRGKGINDL
jgi:HNH endonuclease